MKSMILATITSLVFLLGCEFNFNPTLYLSDIQLLLEKPDEKPLSTRVEFLLEVSGKTKEREREVMEALDGIFPELKFVEFVDENFDTFAKVSASIPVVTRQSTNYPRSLFRFIVDSKTKTVSVAQDKVVFGLINRRLENKFAKLDYEASKMVITVENDLRSDAKFKLLMPTFVNSKPVIPSETDNQGEIALGRREKADIQLSNVFMKWMSDKAECKVFSFDVN
jgi:hypothetical protein